MRALAGIVIPISVLYAGICLALFLGQRSMIYFPQPRRFGTDAAIMKLPVEGAVLAVSTRISPSAQAVVYFGGNGEDVSASMPDLVAAFPDRALYALHYRSYGGSTGKPSQDALFADALALFDRVHATHPQVTVIGRSLGSGVAIYLASLRPAARLVLVTPYDSIAGMAAARFPYLPVRWLIRDPYESISYAPRVTAPTTIVMAEHDEIIPRHSTERLLKHFPAGVASMVIIKGHGHNTLQESPRYGKALARGS